MLVPSTISLALTAKTVQTKVQYIKYWPVKIISDDSQSIRLDISFTLYPYFVCKITKNYFKMLSGFF